MYIGKKSLGILCVVIVLLSGCSQKEAVSTNSHSKKQTESQNKTNSKKIKEDKEKSKQLILEFQNNIFNELDTFTIKWHDFMEDKTTWAAMQGGYSDIAEPKLAEIKSEIEGLRSNIKSIKIPTEIPSEVMLKIDQSKAQLDESIGIQMSIISSLYSYTAEKPDSVLKTTYLDMVKDYSEEVILLQNKFSRSLSEVNALYDIPSVEYFNKQN
ncbi:hypothetical protein [Fictibacillus phosphorivorans]|uniref:hypothetical protein n=1 Tax=Fictibacillus phosphorivorans TaxID=1221500 RepID=UPI0035E85B6B